MGSDGKSVVARRKKIIDIRLKGRFNSRRRNAFREETVL